MNHQFLIIGAGGMGRELYSALRRSGRQPLGFLCDAPDDETMARISRLGAEYLGPVDNAITLMRPYFVAIGNPVDRAHIDRRLRDASALIAPGFIDPTAVVGHDVILGEGSIIGAHASVTTNVRIGRCAIVNTGAVVCHDSQIEDYATLAPGCLICGHVTVEEGAELGASVSVIPHNRVGRWSRVGAGAAVVHSVAARTLSVGVPARAIRVLDEAPQ